MVLTPGSLLHLAAYLKVRNSEPVSHVNRSLRSRGLSSEIQEEKDNPRSAELPVSLKL